MIKVISFDINGTLVSFNTHRIPQSAADAVSMANGLSIIEKVGLGVAMGNDNQVLKKVADYVTSSVDEDGVYNAIKKFVL